MEFHYDEGSREIMVCCDETEILEICDAIFAAIGKEAAEILPPTEPRIITIASSRPGPASTTLRGKFALVGCAVVSLGVFATSVIGIRTIFGWLK